MQTTPSTANPAPATVYGQVASCVSAGTILPAPMPTVSDVRPVRHQARYVRSLARCVRRVASTVSAREGSPSFGSVGVIVELELAVAIDHALAAVAQRRGDEAVSRRDDVGVDGRVVEPELLPALGGHDAWVAVVGVLIGAP